MATDLSESVESLKRLVARPGMFASLFPETTDVDLTATLEDGFAEAQLDGLLKTYVMDEAVVAPDPTRAELALIILYAGFRLVRAELLNRVQHRRYIGAGGVTFEEDFSTNILRDVLASLEGEKTRIRAYILGTDGLNAAAGFAMADQYVARLGGWALF